MISVGKIKSPDTLGQNGGYLVSESVFTSDEESESSVSSDSDEDDSGDSSLQKNSGKKSCQRSYDVASASEHNALLVTETGEVNNLEENRSVIGPIKHDDDENVDDDADSDTNFEDTSSSSESVDSDDTGNIADRRPKSKQFSKVFVVNRNNSSSSETDSQSSDANLEDSSDNDTDIERSDCGVVLNYVKTLPENGDIIDLCDSDSATSITTDEIDLVQEFDENSENNKNICENGVILNSIRMIDYDEIENEVTSAQNDRKNNENVDLSERKESDLVATMNDNHHGEVGEEAGKIDEDIPENSKYNDIVRDVQENKTEINGVNGGIKKDGDIKYDSNDRLEAVRGRAFKEPLKEHESDWISMRSEEEDCLTELNPPLKTKRSKNKKIGTESYKKSDTIVHNNSRNSDPTEVNQFRVYEANNHSISSNEEISKQSDKPIKGKTDLLQDQIRNDNVNKTQCHTTDVDKNSSSNIAIRPGRNGVDTLQGNKKKVNFLSDKILKDHSSTSNVADNNNETTKKQFMNGSNNIPIYSSFKEIETFLNFERKCSQKAEIINQIKTDDLSNPLIVPRNHRVRKDKIQQIASKFENRPKSDDFDNKISKNRCEIVDLDQSSVSDSDILPDFEHKALRNYHRSHVMTKQNLDDDMDEINVISSNRDFVAEIYKRPPRNHEKKIAKDQYSRKEISEDDTKFKTEHVTLEGRDRPKTISPLPRKRNRIGKVHFATSIPDANVSNICSSANEEQETTTADQRTRDDKIIISDKIEKKVDSDCILDKENTVKISEKLATNIATTYDNYGTDKSRNFDDFSDISKNLTSYNDLNFFENASHDYNESKPNVISNENNNEITTNSTKEGFIKNNSKNHLQQQEQHETDTIQNNLKTALAGDENEDRLIITQKEELTTSGTSTHTEEQTEITQVRANYENVRIDQNFDTGEQYDRNSHDHIILKKVAELDTISKDVNSILEIPKPETEHLVEKLIKDVQSINEDHLKKTISESSSSDDNTKHGNDFMEKPDSDRKTEREDQQYPREKQQPVLLINDLTDQFNEAKVITPLQRPDKIAAAAAAARVSKEVIFDSINTVVEIVHNHSSNNNKTGFPLPEDNMKNISDYKNSNREGVLSRQLDFLSMVNDLQEQLHQQERQDKTTTTFDRDCTANIEKTKKQQKGNEHNEMARRQCTLRSDDQHHSPPETRWPGVKNCTFTEIQQENYDKSATKAADMNMNGVSSGCSLPYQGSSAAGKSTTALQEQSQQQNKKKSVENELSYGAEDHCGGCGTSLSAKYRSLVMIRQNQEATSGRKSPVAAQVSVITTQTTHIVSSASDSEDHSSVIVQHTNGDENNDVDPNSYLSTTGYYATSLDSKKVNNITSSGNSTILQLQEFEASEDHSDLVGGESYDSVEIIDTRLNSNESKSRSSSLSSKNDDVTVVTGANTLSAVVCLEDGLADDDSWVEEISHDEEEFATNTATDSDLDSGGEDMSLSSLIDREEELRGYNRTAIDFTLHTIVEESCEESEVEQNDKKKNRMSASELEKYFFYGLGDGKPMSSIDTKEDSASEVSSVCSEGLDSLGVPEEPINDISSAAELASSRLEKYFLTGFMGFSIERNESDESGSVGSDSEGHPSPGQRRKRLVRARGTPRSHSSSLDNLLAKEDGGGTEFLPGENHNAEAIDSSESETDLDETVIHIEKGDNQNDTIKRKKQSRKRHDSDDKKSVDLSYDDGSDKNECKTPQPEFLLPAYNNLAQSKKQHSRDSGFIGSNDDLLKNDDTVKSPELRVELEEIKEDSQEAKEPDGVRTPTEAATIMIPTSSTSSTITAAPQAQTAQSCHGLTRKDSFNNWSSDEETNLMMSKMRQFFKTLVAASANAQNMSSNSRTSTPIVSGTSTPKQTTPVPRLRSKSKPAQLAYFESELTRLMKTVPGINDEQVREIVEYLSSEDTWSDSYDSSDYTSSDLEGAVGKSRKAELKEQISASCQQIINKFDSTVNDEEGDRGDGGLIDESHGLNPETALVYQKLVASFSKMATESSAHADVSKSGTDTANKSPQLLAKVMHHIGTRLVALMHEVSSGDSHASNSPLPPQRHHHHHRKLHQKISVTTTEDDDDSASDSNIEKSEDAAFGVNSNNLPRSKSHDLLLSEVRPQHHQSSSGVSDIAGEEKEASDYERFSWRGSFESALLANGDSRTKLTLLDRDNSSSASALAAKRRSAGDLLFNHKSLSREQLDRVRSCGSIGGNAPENDLESSKLWGSATSQGTSRRRSSVPDAICESGTSDDDHDGDDSHNFPTRSTLPRSLQATSSASTNSLPRLPTSGLSTPMQKSQSVYHFLPNSVKSARYRPPGFNSGRPNSVPKKAASTSGLQQLIYTKRDARRRLNLPGNEEANAAAEVCNSPLIGNRNVSGSASPIASHGSASSDPWPSQSDEDIDRLVALHQNRNSLSSLGVRSDSMASVYSGAGEGRYGTVTVKGQVEFGMQYNYKQSALEIHVVRCRDLAAVDIKRNRSDPYVKVYLLPDKSKSGKRKTKVKKHTLNPMFDETLKFHMPLSSLESRTLWLTVWHSDMFGRNDFLGEVTINLAGKVFDNPQSQWYLLQERSEPFDDVSVYRGDIIVGLKFIPPESSNSKQSMSRGSNSNLRKFGSIKSSSKNVSSKGQLHVLVKEAKNLSPVKASGTCDAFCKSYLLPDKTRSSKQKTPVVKRSVNPVWNYTFIYEDVSLQELAERGLELTIWDHDRLASNEFLGGVRFSLGTGKHYGKPVDWMDATGKELSLWQNMLNRPNFWVEGGLVLRSSLDGIRALP